MGLGIGTGEGRSAAVQAGYQLACLATTLALAIIGGVITGQLVHEYVTKGGGVLGREGQYVWQVA